MTRTLLSLLGCVLALGAIPPALAITPVTHTRGTPQAAPTRPSAPLTGVVTSIDAAKHVIAINRQSYLIGAPLLALIDKRPTNDGLLSLDKVVTGMTVQYRAANVAEGMRIVELWVIQDVDTMRAR